MHREWTVPLDDGFPEMAMKTEGEEMLAGLTAAQKHLPSKFFYDETGSKLFEQITRLGEYYPTRTDKSILERHAGELMQGVEGASLVEIGSGDCSKISILLQALPRETLRTLTYVPVDVSLSAMEESRCSLQKRFGAIEVRGIVADFMQQIHLVSQYENRVFCFFGSTIGNLERGDAVRFVAKLGQLMKTGERLLLGLDMVKDKAVLERAYNDELDVTARFNKNILNVANKIFRAQIFRSPCFLRRGTPEDRDAPGRHKGHDRQIIVAWGGSGNPQGRDHSHGELPQVYDRSHRGVCVRWRAFSPGCIHRQQRLVYLGRLHQVGSSVRS